MSTNVSTFFFLENKRVGRYGLLISGLCIMTVSMRACGCLLSDQNGY